MNQKILMLFVLLAFLSVNSNLVQAVSPPVVPPPVITNSNADLDNIKELLTQKLRLNISSIKPSPVKHILEIVTEQGLLYVSDDGRFLIQGTLYGLGTKIENLTDKSLDSVRVDGIAKFANDMIVFPAKDEKYVVNVFTDITCGYCRKMHEQIDDYNAKGITIRYLAYPRSGVTDRTGNYSQGFNDLRSIWCHEDPNKALTEAKNGGNVAQRICDKPIADEFYFGRQVGVTGTPALIFSNGKMLPGYQSPENLLTTLKANVDKG